MGQQQLRRFCAVVMLVKVLALLPHVQCIPDGSSSVATILSALQNPGAEGSAYSQLMGHKHTLSQGHLERSLAFMGEAAIQPL